MAKKYVKRKDSDTWHWCTNCTGYPHGGDVDERFEHPTSGELCDQCLAKTAHGKCQK
jgi:hypothetical protein